MILEFKMISFTQFLLNSFCTHLLNLCSGKVIPINFVRCGLKAGLKKLLSVLELYQIPRSGKRCADASAGDTSEIRVKIDAHQGATVTEEHDEVSPPSTSCKKETLPLCDCKLHLYQIMST